MTKLIQCLCKDPGRCIAEATQEDFLCDPCREYAKEKRQLDNMARQRTGIHCHLNTGYHGHLKLADHGYLKLPDDGHLKLADVNTMSSIVSFLVMTAGVEDMYRAEELDLTNGRDGLVIKWSTASNSRG